MLWPVILRQLFAILCVARVRYFRITRMRSYFNLTISFVDCRQLTPKTQRWNQLRSIYYRPPFRSFLPTFPLHRHAVNHDNVPVWHRCRRRSDGGWGAQSSRLARRRMFAETNDADTI